MCFTKYQKTGLIFLKKKEKERIQQENFKEKTAGIYVMNQLPQCERLC
jgi:hypothetical protein